MSARLWLAALLAAALGWAAPAAAQDAANGAQLYGATLVSGKRSCSNSACHGTLPAGAQNRIGNGIAAGKIQASIAAQDQMHFLAGQLSNQQLNDLAAHIAAKLGGTAAYLPVAAAPKPALAPAGINFGSQTIAVATPAQTITVSNAASATAALLLGPIGITAGSDFSLAGGSCQDGLSLAAGASCTVAVVFRPTLAGTRSGSLTLAHNGGGSTAALIGTGGDTAPTVVVSPTQLTFAETLGATSASQRVLVSNTGQAALVLNSISIGGSHAADFSLGSDGSCATGGTVPVAANCSIDVRFTPSAAGSRNAQVQLQHNAGSGSSTIALVGQVNAAPAPNLSLNASALDLGTQALGLAGTARTLLLGNVGAAELRFSAFTVSGLHAADIVLGGSCSTSTALPPQGQCTVTLALRPSGLGTRSAQLDIASNTPSGTASVSLQGDAIALPAPVITLSQPALGFGRVTVGTSSVPRSATLGNSGSAALEISAIGSSGPDFAVTHNCPASLAAGNTCNLGVTYTPREGNAAEQVVIQSNAFSSPNSIVLTGLGVTTSLPVLAWSDATTALDFGSVEVGQVATGRTLTLQNQGPGQVTISAFGLAGADPAAFSIGGGSCLGGVQLAQGASCTVIVSFVPDLAGTRTATLLVASDGSNPPDIGLSGLGAASTGGGAGGGGGGGTGGGGSTPSTGVTPFAADRASIDFRAIVIRTGGRSEPLSLRLTNRSNASATMRSVVTSAGFVVQTGNAADACRGVPWTLAPGASCTLEVVFAPSTGGTGTGTLRVTAEDNTVLEVPLQAEARTAVTNVGAGAASAWWLLLLALATALLAAPFNITKTRE